MMPLTPSLEYLREEFSSGTPEINFVDDRPRSPTNLFTN